MASVKQEDLDALKEAMVPFVKVSERYGKNFLQYYGNFVSNLKESSNDFQNPLLRKMSKAAEKDFFTPKELIEGFLEGIKPTMYLLFDKEILTKLFSKNIPAYKKRIKQNLPLWAHIEEEDEKGEKYDSTNTLSDEDFENLEPVKDEKYLRPTWMCQVNAQEIRAKASDLRSKVDSDREFAEEVYDFVKNEKAMLYKPLNSALDTFKSMGGFV